MLDENKPVRQDDDNLEKIIDTQAKRLQELNAATILIKGKQNIKDELRRAYEEVLQISSSILETKKMLLRINEQSLRSKELLTLIDALDKRILHQEENVPPELIQGYQNATVSSPHMLKCTVNSMHHQLTAQIPSSSKIIEKLKKTDCKRTLFNEPEVCPTIPFITLEEFNKVPKYIIGRQTTNNLDTINNFISAINQTLIAKYTILSLGKAAAQKKGEINLFLHYKKQEFDIREENGYLYFFTAEDFYRQTKTKIDKPKLNLLTALRHCKRLRECRIKNDLRYVIISN
ncbi:spindle and kinetochore-associated protein 1 [Monomorium pharaonis]|uniref:spindle and kinetochore-associated protein 1 n=1 Tax=Monomorium pharaonis TaxID=307658 RepID=UPI00063EFBAA|nr:spindle and kinetochore-associated protein 1 [Monomorium pharaonis]XP_012542334.1 spindle and kinetochore-associated protein 1 [Monomorium pharaonis]XP_012542336.1 spindle and kinetochore-associated protein 1 [Monomorium pharaonis]